MKDNSKKYIELKDIINLGFDENSNSAKSLLSSGMTFSSDEERDSYITFSFDIENALSFGEAIRDICIEDDETYDPFEDIETFFNDIEDDIEDDEKYVKTYVECERGV